MLSIQMNGKTPKSLPAKNIAVHALAHIAAIQVNSAKTDFGPTVAVGSGSFDDQHRGNGAPGKIRTPDP